MEKDKDDLPHDLIPNDPNVVGSSDGGGIMFFIVVLVIVLFMWVF